MKPDRDPLHGQVHLRGRIHDVRRERDPRVAQRGIGRRGGRVGGCGGALSVSVGRCVLRGRFGSGSGDVQFAVHPNGGAWTKSQDLVPPSNQLIVPEPVVHETAAGTATAVSFQVDIVFAPPSPTA